MPSYHFSMGNSSVGPIGLCARVTAGSREEAVDLLKAAIDTHVGVYRDLAPNQRKTGVEYMTVYFGTDNITVEDIDDEEPAPSDRYDGRDERRQLGITY